MSLPFGCLLASLRSGKVHNGAVEILELLGLPDKCEGFAALLAARKVLPLPEEILPLLDPAANTCHPRLSTSLFTSPIKRHFLA